LAANIWGGIGPNDLLSEKVHEIPFLPILPFFGGRQSAFDKNKNGFFGPKFS
jgi:hypothetical protein